ncbi:YacL family protein [Vibrio sp. AK197]
MDYEFKKNTLDGSYTCSFSMGHEVLGRWLQEEVGNRLERVEEIFDLIVSSKKNNSQTFQLVGREISMFISNNEVEIKQNALEGEGDELSGESFEIYDSESVSYCGLEDFDLVMQDWKKFIMR